MAYAPVLKQGDRWTTAALLTAAMVLGAMLYNPALCFAYTAGLPINDTITNTAEAALIGVILLAVCGPLIKGVMVPAILLLGWIEVLRLVNTEISLKVLVDVAVPVAFATLGKHRGSLWLADRIVWISIVVVLAFGLFEMFDLPLFERYFDVLGFYIERGLFDPQHAGDTGTRLFGSGIRPEGRSLLPFLGDHRVSSVFLEPVGCGNFPVICIPWLIIRWRAAPRMNAAMLACAVAITILADARFGVACTLIILGVIASPLPRMRTFVGALPFAVIVLLLGYAATVGHTTIDDSLDGRLFKSGDLLQSWTLPQWLAIDPSFLPTYDSGYGYFLGNIGLPAAGLLWLAFAGANMPTLQGDRFRAAMAIYLCTGLSIAGSVLSIKTAGLLWFLYGALQAAPLGVPAERLARGLPWRRAGLA